MTFHVVGCSDCSALWIIDESGGDLAFEENEPRGTEVIIRLPAAE